MAKIDHTNCTHPRTPAGRRACRAALNDPTPVAGIPGTSLGEMRQGFRDSEIKMTGPVARRMARHAAKAEIKRIQPKRSGARVAIDNSGCVQAALHVDAHGGRCACGWVADKVA